MLWGVSHGFGYEGLRDLGFRDGLGVSGVLGFRESFVGLWGLGFRYGFGGFKGFSVQARRDLGSYPICQVQGLDASEAIE